MGSKVEKLEFVNRTEELINLQSWVSPENSPPCLVFIRAPSGVGKSSLTDRLLRTVNPRSSLGVIVDPDIRARATAASVYDGFFLQKCAKILADLSAETGVSFALIARKSGWEKATDKDLFGLLRTYPGISSLWAAGVDYAERIFGFGKYSSDKLLESDSAIAIRLSREFVTQSTSVKHTILIIRECQHIDHHSLHILLELQRRSKTLTLIMEYTTDQETFDPDHAKLIFREIDGHKNAYILDLDFLDRKNLEYLLKHHVGGDMRLQSEYYAQWDGNLRTLSEIKYRVGLARQIGIIEDVSSSLLDFDSQLKTHLMGLRRREQAILAILAVHEDEIPTVLVQEILSALEPNIDREKIDTAIGELIEKHAFIRERSGELSLDNEDIAFSILNAREFTGLLAASKKLLRESYLKRLEIGDYFDFSLFACLRRAFRFCAETGDASGLLQLTSTLSLEVAKSNDQAKFVKAIRNATHKNSSFLDHDRHKLIEWAGYLAYDIADFDQASNLLDEVSSHSAENTILYANSLMETGEHQKARQAIRQGREMWSNENAGLAFTLSEGVIFRSLNKKDAAETAFQSVACNPAAKDTVWEAFAFRFMETVLEFDEALDNVLKAADAFERLGLQTTEAYTRLTAAAHLCRAGFSQKALEQIHFAAAGVGGHVHDSHILANNKACALAFQDEIDFDEALREMEIARAMAGDDFSRVAAQTNSAAIYAMSGNMSRAIEHADISIRILQNASFGDKVVHWPVLFNTSMVYERSGRNLDAISLRKTAIEGLTEPIIYKDYWRLRYGISNQSIAKYAAMTKLPFHFVFLSHWQIDREALSVLS